MKNIFLVLTLFGLCCGFAGCSGNECSATHTTLEDPDSDCEIDGDNCPTVYNPNQEDTDEDEFGDACEAPQCVNDANCVGTLFQMQETAYNLRGLYETSEKEKTQTVCDQMDTLSLSQTEDTITVIDELGNTLIGRVYAKSLSSTLTQSAFQNQDTYCQMTFHTDDFTYKLKCYDKIAKDFCETTGFRSVVEVTRQ